ncbi:MAG: biopolymer transporter Tol [Proteobacteria bacterium]|nr:biopolymer transporter Tol [Pseudomonadota bacterium]NBS50384.1 biopolymer transporter Tol [Verrucomicrobiota bacterium]NBT24388.1 biopolymer transporter Tol [bacterium]NBV97321.1 biopolymer transporter Tol [Verrucomicrobiota bacterium]
MLLSLAMKPILPILLLTPCLLFSQSAAPVIVIEQTRKVDVAVSPIAGAEGPALTKVLQNDLERSGVCRVVEPASAAFTLSGTLTPSGLAGRAAPKAGGAPLIDSSYNGEGRRAIHQFADAFVEALTGTPGFASSKITFASASGSKKNSKKEIYIADIDGANARQLTQDGALGYGPKFSPDGNKIAYSSDKSGYRDTYVIDLPSKKRSIVAQFPGQNTGASFSPDGSTLALSLSKFGNPEICTIPSSGGQPTRLTNTRGTDCSPSWSPDGTKIVYVSDERGSPGLYILPATGGTPEKLNTESSYTTEPDWSPDGKKIAYSITSGGGQIGVYDIDSKKARIVSRGSGLESPSWTRNSRHLVCSQNGTLVLLDSLTGEAIKIPNNLSNNTEPNTTR